jgi:gluconate 2-dehydrogenase alpha chain
MYFRDRWIKPFPAAGVSQNVSDEWNNDNFDHSGLGFMAAVTSTPTSPTADPWRRGCFRREHRAMVPDGSGRAPIGTRTPSRSPYTAAAAGTRKIISASDPTYRDAFGPPLVRLTFDFHDNEVKMSQFLARKAGEFARATGPSIVGPEMPRSGPCDVRVCQTTHVTGTPMGAHPETSVVSPHLQRWDAENLFVVGASTYPQDSGYNPRGPLGALALRLGDDLTSYVERPRHL